MGHPLLPDNSCSVCLLGCFCILALVARSVVPVQVQEELPLLSLLAVLLLLPLCSFLSLFVNPPRTSEDICRDVAAVGTGPEPRAL